MQITEFNCEDSDCEDTFPVRVVGLIKTDETGVLIASDQIVERVADTADGIYSFAVGAMPQGRDAVRDVVAYCYRTGVPVRAAMVNQVAFELDAAHEVFQALSTAFFYVGIFFVLFASLMLANFISTSISHKKQEIGILRAIGSRSNDVFRIFFSESFLIAMINFVLSTVCTFGLTMLINRIFRESTRMLITVLNFGVRQIGLLLAVSVAVAFIASFIPVKRIASKRPIDAIRGR